MTGELFSPATPAGHPDDLSAIAIQRSHAAAVRLWDEITQLLVGDPFAPGRAQPAKPGKPTR